MIRRRPRPMRTTSRTSRGMSAALTPLLDTLFLLLFALLSLSQSPSTQEEAVGIELPSIEPSSESSGTAQHVIAFAIDSNSKIRLSGAEPLKSSAELDAALGKALGDRLPEETLVRIRADQDARHGTAVQLLEHLRVAGFVNVQWLASADADGPDWIGEDER